MRLKRGDIFNLTKNDLMKVDVRNGRAIELSELAGEYIVTSTRKTGGGYGHGSGDYYPDGMYVTARKIGNQEVSVGFYQSGCFCNCLPNIATIKR